MRARSERAGFLDGCETVLENEPKEEEEEEYAAGDRKHPARNPVGVNQGLENENELTSAQARWGFTEEQQEDLPNR